MGHNNIGRVLINSYTAKGFVVRNIRPPFTDAACQRLNKDRCVDCKWPMFLWSWCRWYWNKNMPGVAGTVPILLYRVNGHFEGEKWQEHSWAFDRWMVTFEPERQKGEFNQ